MARLERIDRTAHGDAADDTILPQQPSTDEPKNTNDDRAAELDNPETQFRILRPNELTYMLTLMHDVERREGDRRIIESEPYEKEIKIQLALTPNDIHSRRIMDELESLLILVGAEARGFDPEMAALDADFINSHPGYLQAALASPVVRQKSRSLIAKLAKVPVEEISNGMRTLDLSQLQMLLMTFFNEEVVRLSKQKNGSVLPSAPPQSTPSSKAPTAGRKSTSKKK